MEKKILVCVCKIHDDSGPYFNDIFISAIASLPSHSQLFNITHCWNAESVPGAWGLYKLHCYIMWLSCDLLSPPSCSVRQAVCCLVQQSNEKIDRTRAHACSRLMTIVHHSPPIPHIPHHKDLLSFFQKWVFYLFFLDFCSSQKLISLSFCELVKQIQILLFLLPLAGNTVISESILVFTQPACSLNVYILLICSHVKYCVGTIALSINKLST